jgi:hypothetical protein
MHPIATLVQLAVLFGSTLLIIFVDRSLRRKKPPPADTIPPAEPNVLTLVLLTFLCNVAALPAYFFQTRNKALWGLIGFAAFCFCFGASVVSGLVVNVVMSVLG